MTDTRRITLTIKWQDGGSTSYLRIFDELPGILAELAATRPAWASFTVTDDAYAASVASLRLIAAAHSTD